MTLRLEAARRLAAELIPPFRDVTVDVVPRYFSERTAAGPGGVTKGPSGLEVIVVPADPERGDLMASITVFPFDGTIDGVPLDLPGSQWVSVPDIWARAERLPGQLWLLRQVGSLVAEIRTFNLAHAHARPFEAIWRLAIDEALEAVA